MEDEMSTERDWLRYRGTQVEPRKEGINPEDVLEAIEIANRIASLDVEGLVKARQTPLEQVLEKADVELAESFNRSRRPKPKVHWRTAKKKRRETYHRVTKPRRQMRKAEQLRGGAAGFYAYLRTGWVKSGTEFTLTEAEFTEHIWPAIAGRLPMFLRYDPKQPVSLYNVYVVDVDNERVVLYDGKEQQLKSLGAIL